MHGRPQMALKPEDAAASAAKAQKLTALQSRYTKEALDTSAKLLEINPEHHSTWDYRKLTVLSRFSLRARVGAFVLVHHPSPPQAPRPPCHNHLNEFEEARSDAAQLFVAVTAVIGQTSIKDSDKVLTVEDSSKLIENGKSRARRGERCSGRPSLHICPSVRDLG